MTCCFSSLLSGVFLHDRGAAVDPVPEGSSLLQNEGLSGISYWHGEENLIRQSFHTFIKCLIGQVLQTQGLQMNAAHTVCFWYNLMGNYLWLSLNTVWDIVEISSKNFRGDMWDYWGKKQNYKRQETSSTSRPNLLWETVEILIRCHLWFSCSIGHEIRFYAV